RGRGRRRLSRGRPADRRRKRPEGGRAVDRRRDRGRRGEGIARVPAKWMPVRRSGHAPNVKREHRPLPQERNVLEGETRMPKGYWIPHIDVRDAEGYKGYMAATPPAHEKYKGVALVRGGKMEVVEGRARARVVLREFPDYAAALACYRSPEYQSARPMALANPTGDFVSVQG